MTIFLAKTVSGKIGLSLLGIALAMFVAGISVHLDAIIATLPPTVVALIGFWNLFRGQREIHLTLNSKLTELVETSKRAAHAEGKLEEREEERVRKQKIIEPTP